MYSRRYHHVIVSDITKIVHRDMSHLHLRLHLHRKATLDLNSELAIKLLIQLDSDNTILVLPLIVSTLLLPMALLAVRGPLARLLGSKDLHSADTCVFGHVIERARNLQHAVFVREFDFGRRLLLDAVAVVEVEFAAGFAVAVRRDDQVEGLSADFGCGEGAFGAEGDDGAAADVKGNFGEGNVIEGDFGALALYDLPGVEGVEAVVGEVDGDAGAVLFCDGRDEDVGAVEELQGVTEDVGVIGVGEEEGVDQRGAVDGLLVEGGVDVVEQAVADVVGVAGGFCNGLPEVEFLGDGGVSVVVAREWVECFGDG